MVALLCVWFVIRSGNGCAISYHGKWRDRHRSLIDHIVISPTLADQIQGVAVFTGNLAVVASDHYPVYIDITADRPDRP